MGVLTGTLKGLFDVVWGGQMWWVWGDVVGVGGAGEQTVFLSFCYTRFECSLAVVNTVVKSHVRLQGAEYSCRMCSLSLSSSLSLSLPSVTWYRQSIKPPPPPPLSL